MAKKFTFKGLFNLKVFKFKFSFPRQNKNFGGFRDRLEKEFTVHPKNCFLFVPFVTIVIPVEKSEKTDVKFFIFYLLVVALERLELSRSCPHRILNPARLPFRHNALK